MLIDAFKKYKSCIVAIEKVPLEKVQFHGVIKGVEIDKNVYLIEDMIEKPKIENAPSNLVILGRYILTPEIFNYLRDLKPGYGGEIQLTDALKLMCKNHKIYGILYPGKRYDIGNKLEWQKLMSN